MKRKYINPQSFCSSLETTSLLAVSVQQGTADPNQPILVKEGSDMDFDWGESVFNE